MGVAGVSVSQGLKQRLFHYGNVHIDVLGKWDVNTDDVVNPFGLQSYLEGKFVKSGNVTNVLSN